LDDTLGGTPERFAWLGDIAIDRGPALFQSLVVGIDRMNCGALLIKYDVIFGGKLDGHWKLVLETTYKKVEEEGGFA